MEKKVQRITKDLEWKVLKENYKIGQVKYNGKFIEVNELDEAIKSGELLETLQKCANELHNGSLPDAIKAYRRTLSSQYCNMKKSDYVNPTDNVRYDLLDKYTAQFVNKSTNSIVPGKAKWQYTVADIMSLEGNHEELRKLLNSMADKKSKYPDDIVDMTEYQSRLDLVKKLKKEAEEPKVNNDILAKLKANKKLTAEEAKELLNLLNR